MPLSYFSNLVWLNAERSGSGLAFDLLLLIRDGEDAPRGDLRVDMIAPNGEPNRCIHSGIIPEARTVVAVPFAAPGDRFEIVASLLTEDELKNSTTRIRLQLTRDDEETPWEAVRLQAAMDRDGRARAASGRPAPLGRMCLERALAEASRKAEPAPVLGGAEAALDLVLAFPRPEKDCFGPAREAASALIGAWLYARFTRRRPAIWGDWTRKLAGFGARRDAQHVYYTHAHGEEPREIEIRLGVAADTFDPTRPPCIERRPREAYADFIKDLRRAELTQKDETTKARELRRIDMEIDRPRAAKHHPLQEALARTPEVVRLRPLADPKPDADRHNSRDPTRTLVRILAFRIATPSINEVFVLVDIALGARVDFPTEAKAARLLDAVAPALIYRGEGRLLPLIRRRDSMVDADQCVEWDNANPESETQKQEMKLLRHMLGDPDPARGSPAVGGHIRAWMAGIAAGLGNRIPDTGGKSIEQRLDSEPDSARAAGADDAAVEAVFAPTDPVRADPSVEIEALRAENAAMMNRLLRTQAEIEKQQRRAEREVADAKIYGVTRFAREALAFADTLRRAIDTVPAHARAALDADLATLIEGVELTERDFHARLERFGVERIDAPGGRFDPNQHEALFEIPDESQPSGTVAQVIEPGYLIGGRVLRPAKVGVTRGGPRAG